MIWNIKDRTEKNLLDQVLANRGLTKDQFDSFLNPDFARDMFDPYLLKDMEKAVKRILQAKEKGEKIGIFADYDADGIPGAALMYRALNKLKIDCVVYIPTRESGYGLNEEGIGYLVSEGASLILTIDLGIRSIAEAEFCKKKKIDLIISDHHLSGVDLPDALALINPKRDGDKYPFKDLCGCGVSYKIIQALAKHFPTELNENFLKWNLDLVAISTIADVVAITGENRLFAKFGLVVLNKTKNLGIEKIIQKASLKTPIGAYGVGFQIAPRINAPGRIDHATKSFEILISEDMSEVDDLALWLEEKNIERQDQMATVEAEATAKIEKDGLNKNNILVVEGDWPKGVIGPTASRLVEKYSKPVILLSKEREIYTGSARSISGVHIVNLLENLSSLLIKYGGHAGAAGMSVARDKLERFKTAIISECEDIDPEVFQKKINIECEVLPNELDIKTVVGLAKLEPFGMGNPRPVFVLRNIEVKYMRMVGKESNHTSFRAEIEGKSFKSIYFSRGDETMKIENGKKYDLALSLEIDNWNDQEQVSLNVCDIRGARD